MAEQAQLTFDKATELLRQNPGLLTFRDRVVIGLTLKMLSAFRALIQDADSRRAEAMHHYKTLVESYIHFQYVVSETSDRRAAEVLLKAHEHRLLIIQENGEAFKDERQFVDEEIVALKNDGIGRLPTLEVLATLAGVAPWYSRTYRAACEPAHINDLLDFMPDSVEQRLEGLAPVLAESMARTAIDWAIAVALNVFQVANTNSLGLALDVTGYQTRYETIRAAAR
jgi:hypothetical protein